jgi:hypothetical protein
MASQQVRENPPPQLTAPPQQIIASQRSPLRQKAPPNVHKQLLYIEECRQNDPKKDTQLQKLSNHAKKHSCPQIARARRGYSRLPSGQCENKTVHPSCLLHNTHTWHKVPMNPIEIDMVKNQKKNSYTKVFTLYHIRDSPCPCGC